MEADVFMENPVEEKSINPPPAFPGLAQSFGLIGYLVLFSFLLAIPTFWFGLTDFGTTLVYAVSILMIIHVANKKRGSGGFALKPIPYPLYFIILVISPAWIIVIEPVIGLFPFPDWARDMFESMLPDSFFNVITPVVFAPILEELLFRGIILDGFLKRYNPWKAIVLSSFLFGFVHLNPWQFTTAFGMGIFMGWMYWKTGSLLPGIFLHFINNALAVVASLTFDPFSTTKQIIGNDTLYYLVFAGALVGLVLSCFLCHRILAQSTWKKISLT